MEYEIEWISLAASVFQKKKKHFLFLRHIWHPRGVQIVDCNIKKLELKAVTADHEKEALFHMWAEICHPSSAGKKSFLSYLDWIYVIFLRKVFF